VLLALAMATPASAAAVSVTQGTVSNEDSFVETELCAFPFNGHEAEAGHFTVLRDAAGNFVRAEVHIALTAEYSAHGITIYESDHWTDFFFPDGTHRKIGDTQHITGPGGLIQNDAGLIFTVGSDDNIVDFHGRLTLNSGPLCSALQP
jgi:hypothetical protein